MQTVFGHLMESKLQYYEPEQFWKVFKLWGQPVNIREQQDAFEFFTNLTDQLDEHLKVITVLCKSKRQSFNLWTQVGVPISLEKQFGPDSYSTVWGSVHLHNEPVTYPALPIPIYTLKSRGVIMVKCLTHVPYMLTVTWHEPTTFCLWTRHWSARPHTPTLLCTRLKWKCGREGLWTRGILKSAQVMGAAC